MRHIDNFFSEEKQMKKGLVVGLVGLVMFFAFLIPVTVWAQKTPSLQAGAPAYEADRRV